MVSFSRAEMHAKNEYQTMTRRDATSRPNFERRPQMPPYDNSESRKIADCEGWYNASLALGGKSDSLTTIYVKQQPSGKIN